VKPEHVQPWRLDGFQPLPNPGKLGSKNSSNA
jgi:hypothetical protein